jgi:hypothetical protein
VNLWFWNGHHKGFGDDADFSRFFSARTILEPAYKAEIPQVSAEIVIASRIGTCVPINPASPVDNKIPLVVIEDDAAKTLPRSSSEV